MPNFTLQKGEGCLDSVAEKAIMKMQKKTQWHTRGLAAQFIEYFAHLRISTYQLHAGMIFTTLFVPWKRRERLFKKCLPWYENSILFFENSSENFL